MRVGAYSILMEIIERLKEFLRGFTGNPPTGETREPTIIEKRSTCPLCIGSVDKIDNSQNKAPSRENRHSGRDDL